MFSSSRDNRDELLTAAAVAAILGVRRNYVYELVERGEFPNASKVGREWRIPRSDVDVYLERHRVRVG